MTYEELLDFIKGYDEFNNYMNSFYELSIMDIDWIKENCGKDEEQILQSGDLGESY